MRAGFRVSADRRRLHYGGRVHDPTLVMPPPRRRGRMAVLVAGLVVLGCCVAGATAAFVRQALRGADATPSVTHGIGDAVRDGQFEFVVTSVSCGHDEIVNGILRATPQGQFCVLELRVANVGDKPRQFADGAQRAFGPNGDQYAADTGAGLVANGSGVAYWNTVNPGNSIEAKVVFDLPPGATISSLELHDSGLSGGVRVTVAG